MSAEPSASYLAPERTAVRFGQWLALVTIVPIGLLACVQGYLTGTLSPWLVAMSAAIALMSVVLLVLWNGPLRARATVLGVGITAVSCFGLLHFGPMLGVGLAIATTCAMWTIFFGRVGMIGGVGALLAFVAVVAWAHLHGAVSVMSRRTFEPSDPISWLRMWLTLAAGLVYLNGVLHVLHRRYRSRLEGEMEARRAAEEATRLRDEFILLASHELRTPLTSIKLTMQSRRAKDGCDDPSMATLERQLARFERLVLSMLETTLLASGRTEITPEPVDLAEVARDVMDSVAVEARRAGSSVVLSATRPVVGSWDRAALHLVLTNLLGNAIKFGEGKPIDVTVVGTHDEARLVVRDHGMGIPDDELDRIFARFHRGVSHQHYGGLGLGLYITRQMVKLHGGTVSVESKPGKGATFTVVLPVRPVEVALSSAQHATT